MQTVKVLSSLKLAESIYGKGLVSSNLRVDKIRVVSHKARDLPYP